jgi:hypothetical protein
MRQDRTLASVLKADVARTGATKGGAPKYTRTEVCYRPAQGRLGSTYFSKRSVVC